MCPPHPVFPYYFFFPPCPSTSEPLPPPPWPPAALATASAVQEIRKRCTARFQAPIHVRIYSHTSIYSDRYLSLSFFFLRSTDHSFLTIDRRVSHVDRQKRSEMEARRREVEKEKERTITIKGEKINKREGSLFSRCLYSLEMANSVPFAMFFFTTGMASRRTFSSEGCSLPIGRRFSIPLRPRITGMARNSVSSLPSVST